MSFGERSDGGRNVPAEDRADGAASGRGGGSRLIPREGAPLAADCAVRMEDDTMEPYIMRGSRFFVLKTAELSDGDAGVFLVGGKMMCRQYFEDCFGNIYLKAANRDRPEADVTVTAASGIPVYCFGKVLLERRIPIPRK